MNTSLSHLPEYKQTQLREITSIIVQAIAPEKVILFGSHATGRWVEDKYVSDGILYEYISDYDILVITKADEGRKDYEVQDIIENRCHYHTPVTVIVHDITFVNKMLSEGQYFFTDIEEEGILLYETGDVPLAKRKPLSPAEAKVIAQEYYDQWFESGKEFYIDAQNAFRRGSFKNAAFYLHQAAERTYNAVMLVFTGYKPKTHNLERLQRYTKDFSQPLFAVFPNNTPQEQHLFDLVKRGYVDARYKKNYHITAEELQTLIERVGKLQDIAGPLCLEKISSFDAMTS